MKTGHSLRKIIIVTSVGILLFSLMHAAYSQTNNALLIADPYANDVAKIAVIAKDHAQNPDIQSYIRQLQVKSVLFNPVSPAIPNSSTGQILIFVSASLPRESLMQWFLQAQKIHAAVIMRGLVNNSLYETKKWIKLFIDNTNNQGGMQINPIIFERYGIQQVPAVVATGTMIQYSDDINQVPPSFDVVYGNISLSKALQIISDQGDTANSVAKNALSQLKAST